MSWKLTKMASCFFPLLYLPKLVSPDNRVLLLPWHGLQSARVFLVRLLGHIAENTTSIFKFEIAFCSVYRIVIWSRVKEMYGETNKCFLYGYQKLASRRHVWSHGVKVRIILLRLKIIFWSTITFSSYCESCYDSGKYYEMIYMYNICKSMAYVMK